MNSSASRSGNTISHSQACAACKFQRRKCGPNCILAPYFPPDRQKQFLNAHKLFGVGKINNMIKYLSPSDRKIAMETIVYQAEMRANDPVGGCHRLIQQLEAQIECSHAELQFVLQYLAVFRAQAHQAQHAYEATSSSPNLNLNESDPLSLYNPDNVVEDNNMPHYQYPQPFQPNQIEAFNVNGNGMSMQEDLNAWIMHNPVPLSPLPANNEDGVIRVENGEYGYDQKPMLDLRLNKMNSDNSHYSEGQ